MLSNPVGQLPSHLVHRPQVSAQPRRGVEASQEDLDSLWQRPEPRLPGIGQGTLQQSGGHLGRGSPGGSILFGLEPIEHSGRASLEFAIRDRSRPAGPIPGFATD